MAGKGEARPPSSPRRRGPHSHLVCSSSLLPPPLPPRRLPYLRAAADCQESLHSTPEARGLVCMPLPPENPPAPHFTPRSARSLASRPARACSPWWEGAPPPPPSQALALRGRPPARRDTESSDDATPRRAALHRPGGGGITLALAWAGDGAGPLCAGAANRKAKLTWRWGKSAALLATWPPPVPGRAGPRGGFEKELGWPLCSCRKTVQGQVGSLNYYYVIHHGVLHERFCYKIKYCLSCLLSFFGDLGNDATEMPHLPHPSPGPVAALPGNCGDRTNGRRDMNNGSEILTHPLRQLASCTAATSSEAAGCSVVFGELSVYQVLCLGRIQNSQKPLGQVPHLTRRKQPWAPD